MKEQEAKELEKLIAKAMQKAPLESPSFQFTDNIMEAIKAEEKSITFRYRPLLPKYIWFVIAAIVIGITTYLWLMLQPAPLDFQNLLFSFMEKSTFSKEVAAFSPSKITAYGVLLFAIMLCVQIPVLKSYLSKERF